MAGINGYCPETVKIAGQGSSRKSSGNMHVSAHRKQAAWESGLPELAPQVEKPSKGYSG